MKVSNLAQGTRRVEVDVEGSEEKVGVVYYPGKLTADAVAQITNPKATDAEAREILSDLLESWEIEGDDGEPYPTTPEAIGKLPLGFVGSVIVSLVTKEGTVPEGKGGA